MIVIEAGMLGAVSQALGIVAGLALSVVLIYVINVQSFGWTIQFHIPAAFLAAGDGRGAGGDDAGRRVSGPTGGRVPSGR